MIEKGGSTMKVYVNTEVYGRINGMEHLILAVDDKSKKELEGKYISKQGFITMFRDLAKIKIDRLIVHTWVKDDVPDWRILIHCSFIDKGDFTRLLPHKPTLILNCYDDVPEGKESEYIEVRWIAQ